MSIVITFASSKLGKNIINILLERGFPSNKIIALVRNESRIEEFKSSGIIIRKVDFNNYESIYQGLKGGEKLCFISSGDVPNRGIQHPNIIKAAKENHYKFLAYTSLVRATEDGSSPVYFFEKCHIDTEIDIKAAGIPYTIFINAMYTDVLVELFFDSKTLERGIFVPAGINSSVNFCTRHDMAEATVNVFLEDYSNLSQHFGKEYTLANNVRTTIEEVAEIISQVTGKAIPYKDLDVNAYKVELRSTGIQDSEIIDFNTSVILAVKAGEFKTNKSDIELLLKRSPTSVKDFINQYINNKH